MLVGSGAAMGTRTRACEGVKQLGKSFSTDIMTEANRF